MKKILFIGIALIFVSCGSSNSKSNEQTEGILNEMVNEKTFEMKFNWAYPRVTSAMQQLTNSGLIPNGSTAGSIDLTGIGNYFKMENDSVKAELPYYGERQFGGAYGANAGIEFEDVPQNLNIKNGKNGSYEVRFDVNDKNTNTESYRIFIQLFPNLTSNLTINSSNRNNIQYRGKIYAIDTID
ncbi:DUF4251 domain-containing protein [Flavobacteriaceae bacterium XHP0103]|uniref:DUF4251 domain-containing protein n=1 Tax=Marixanthotalea marina TaxID=2844359 RepID=UPI002989FED9|nr:DUF4251 domain-containing protein [Marixanthotalea marina]MBU3822221.1 DUF4251 domain-containing protein [Marixanthotalea marina]